MVNLAAEDDLLLDQRILFDVCLFSDDFINLCSLGVRENAKYSFCQDWLKEGRLAEFSEAFTGSNAATRGSAGKAKIMKLTHQLVADLHDVRRVIDSINRCIFVAQ